MTFSTLESVLEWTGFYRLFLIVSHDDAGVGVLDDKL